MKTISYKEAIELLNEVGHVSNITIPVDVFDEGGYKIETCWVSILNNGICYDEGGAQIGGGSNEQNAETTINNIRKEFKVHSNYFNSATGHYTLE